MYPIKAIESYERIIRNSDTDRSYDLYRLKELNQGKAIILCQEMGEDSSKDLRLRSRCLDMLSELHLTQSIETHERIVKNSDKHWSFRLRSLRSLALLDVDKAIILCQDMGEDSSKDLRLRSRCLDMLSQLNSTKAIETYERIMKNEVSLRSMYIAKIWEKNPFKATKLQLNLKLNKAKAINFVQNFFAWMFG